MKEALVDDAIVRNPSISQLKSMIQRAPHSRVRFVITDAEDFFAVPSTYKTHDDITTEMGIDTNTVDSLGEVVFENGHYMIKLYANYFSNFAHSYTEPTREWMSRLRNTGGFLGGRVFADSWDMLGEAIGSKIHINPTISKIKDLTRTDPAQQARFVIDSDGDLFVGQAYYTYHHDIERAEGIHDPDAEGVFEWLKETGFTFDFTLLPRMTDNVRTWIKRLRAAGFIEATESRY